MIGIYKITSPENYIYIGESKNIEKRFKSYRSLNCKKQYKLFRSLKEYGVSEHTFEILEECEFENLKCRERYWQDFYDVTGILGLNCLLTQCGEEKQIITEEVKKRISQTKTGQKYTKEHCENISKGNIGKKRSSESKKRISDSKKGKPSPRKGEKHTEETKASISASLLGIPLTEDRKLNISKGTKNKLKVINIITGELFDSIRDASNISGIEYRLLRRRLHSKNNDTDFIFLK